MSAYRECADQRTLEHTEIGFSHVQPAAVLESLNQPAAGFGGGKGFIE